MDAERRSPWSGGELSLPEEYWLLTTGTQEVAAPSHPARVGVAMTALVELERRGEIRWSGPPDDPMVDPIGDCRCPPPLRRWHDAVAATFGVNSGPMAARFALSTLLQDVWPDAARHLVTRGLVREIPRRLGRTRFAVVDVEAVGARRDGLLRGLPPAGTVADLPRRDLDLLIVADASDSTSDVFRVPGLEPPDHVLETIRRVTAPSRLRRHLEAAAAYSLGPSAPGSDPFGGLGL